MTDSGDLLLYGCNVGAGASGQQFVESLAQLTGADVAASDDVTGGVAVGGDWELESVTGLIESVIPVGDVALQQYDQSLGAVDDYILAKMSLVAYYDNPAHPKDSNGAVAEKIASDAWDELKSDGWSILEKKDGIYAPTDYPTHSTAVNSGSGFAATAFKKDNSIVIAYRGTNEAMDWIGGDTAIGSPLPAWGSQFEDAILFAFEIKNQFYNSDIEVTGHSLGGGLAQVVSKMFGFSGATFDPGGSKNIANNLEFNREAYIYTGSLSGALVPNGFINYLVEASPISGIPLLTKDHLGATDTLKEGELRDFLDHYAENHPIKTSLLEIMNRPLTLAALTGIDYVFYSHAMAGILEFMCQKEEEDGINYYGTSKANTISANNSSNVIDGYDGNDTISGNGGNDTIDGGSGNDTAIFSGNFAEYSISLDKNSLVFTVADRESGRDGTDQLVHVESFKFDNGTWKAGDACTVVNGSYRNEYLFGNDLNNRLLGGGGDDVLEGKKGNDTIDGGSGTDAVIFTGTYAEYVITPNADQTSFTIRDTVAGRDGTDLVSGVEQYRFGEDVDVRDVTNLVDGGGGGTGTGGGGNTVSANRVSSSTKLFPGHTMGEFENMNAFAALREDGSVVTWGYSYWGGNSSAVADELNGDVDVVQVFSTNYAFAALREDGSVVTWGYSSWGGNSSAVSDELNGAVDVVQVFSSHGAFAALREDGSVVTWGMSIDAINYGGNSSAVSDELNGDVDVVQVFSSYYAFAALREDGSVVTWGASQGGNSSAVSDELNGAVDVVQVFSTNVAFAALREDGSVVTWGDNYWGGNSSAVSDELNGDVDVVQVFSTPFAFAALREDGSVVTWGASLGGNSSAVSDELNGDVDVVQVFSSHGAFAALREDGSVVTWGVSDYGGNSSAVSDELNGAVDVVQVFSSYYAFAALREDGSVVTWGDSRYGGNSSAVSDELNGAVDVVQVFSTDLAFAALREDGSVVTWGGSDYGGNSSAVSDKLHDVVAISDIYSNGSQERIFSGTDGNDNLTGTYASDILWGNGGNDVLAAMGGNDLAFGGSGNDLLIGGEGEGDDIYVGGEGVDTVKYTSALAGITVDLVEGTAYSTDGNDAAAIGTDVLIDIENVIAGNFNDILIGNSFANSLEGGAGDDWLQGGEGVDTLDGGLGSDTADYSDKMVDLSVTLNGAVDAIVMVGGVAEDTIRNIENLVGGEGNDTFIGDSADNLFLGGAGNDTLDGGSGSDMADYSDKTEAVSVTLHGSLDAIVTVGGVAEDTIRNIENLIGGSGNDTLIGDALANSLSGGYGDDTLQGGAGNDTLDGGADADTMVFRGNLAQYSLTYNFDNQTYTVTDSLSGRDGSDLVTGAEFFQFADGVHAVADLIDIVPPYLQAMSPAEYATNVAIGADIVFTFTEPVQAGTGNMVISNGSDDIRTIAVTDSSQVTISGNTLTINPSEDLAIDQEYTVSIPSGTVVDFEENGFQGFTSSSFTTGSSGGFVDMTFNTTGTVEGSPMDGENYYTFSSSEGVLAEIYDLSQTGINWFFLDLTEDSDGDPATFGVIWNWLDQFEGISSSRTGVITFQDTVLSAPGPELWSMTFSTISPLLVDGTLNSSLDGLPDGFIVKDYQGNPVNVPLTWQAKDSNNVIAVFSIPVKDQQNNNTTLSGSVQDTNNDNLPDRMVGSWGSMTFDYSGGSWIDSNGDGKLDQMVRYEILSGRVQVDGSGNPAGLYMGPDILMITATGSNGADWLYGGSGNDSLYGVGGNDSLYGEGGNDLLDGGTGSDMMLGGAGDDTYVVDSAGDIVTENSDEGTDTVQSSVTCTLGANVENLTLTGTGAINGTGNTLNNLLIGNSGSNTLNGGVGNDTMQGGAGNDTYVVDSSSDVVTEAASAGTDRVQSSVTYTLSANVENLTLNGTASINGTGNTLSNTLVGNSGNNILDGGAGNDTMQGGLGNDTYVVDSTGDVVTEAVSAGTDTVSSSVTYTLSANVENLTLTGTAGINGTGNTLANFMIGSTGNNIISGGAGNDTMQGGAGNDTYVVDSTGDVVIENPDEGTDTISSSVTCTLGSNIENLALAGAAAINGTGNSLANILAGNSGNNILDGGVGNDTMQGGVGNDTYIVDSTGDVVTEATSAGTDTVQSSVTYTLGVNIENLTLTGATAINGTGNILDNLVTGNTGNNNLSGGLGNDTLDGGVGNDTMQGGGGDDTFIVDSASDVVTEATSAGTDTVLSSVTYTLAANIENLTLTGIAAINGTGNILDNVILGNSGNNILDGGAGTDSINGGEGSDLYLVGLAAHHAAAEFADTGVTGSDEVRFTSAAASTLKLYAGDTGIEKVVIGTGIAAAAVTTATTALNVDATEVTSALWIIGNAGANSLTGTGSNDTLDGGAGNDSLTGGNGDDFLIGGNGNDTLTGGNGNDHFVFNFAPNATTNKDTIIDFEPGTDELQFSKAIFTKLGSVGELTAAEFWSGTAARDTSDRIIYNESTGALYYDADGTGAIAAVQVAIIGTATHPVLQNTDIHIIA